MKKKIAIVGAGMSGCFMALCLDKRYYDIEIYETRPDLRKYPYDSGKSFNITLYVKAIEAMKKINIWETVKQFAILAEGNVPHYIGRKPSFDRFDKTGKEVLYTIHRNHLNGLLISLAEKAPHVKMYFNTEIIGINRREKSFYSKEAEKISLKKADMIIGADGVNSLVRSQLQRGQETDHLQEYEDWGYKEVHITKDLAERLNLREHATHTWPRNNSLLLAFPNPDKSLTLMFNLPLHGYESFAYLQTEGRVHEYISKNFPDLTILLPQITKAILTKPTGTFVTIVSDPWYYRNFMILIGDAAHGVTPFYGQGVSAAFEDCVLLSELLVTNQADIEQAFAYYQKKRKRNTDVLAYLSRENFLELRDRSRSSYHLFKAKANTLLNQLFPSWWMPPLYQLIAHDTTDYADAYEQFRKQEKISRWIGLDLLIALGTIPFAFFRMINKNVRG